MSASPEGRVRGKGKAKDKSPRPDPEAEVDFYPMHASMSRYYFPLSLFKKILICLGGESSREEKESKNNQT